MSLLLKTSYLLASATQTAGRVEDETVTSVARFIAYIIDRLPNWIAAGVLLVLSFLLAKIARNVVVGRVSEQVDEDHQEVTVLAGRATFVIVLVLGLTTALAIAGIDLTAIIAAVGFGVSFAMQDLIMNFIAGVMILLARQFTINDFIKVGDTIGQIEEIQARYTRLKALDGTRVIVPNRDLFSNQVISFTSNSFRRIEVVVGVDYSTPLKKAVGICMEVMKNHEGILEQPPAQVLLTDFADSSINFSLRFWVQSTSNWLQIKSELVIDLKEAFDKAGITIPFPIRTIYDGDKALAEKQDVALNSAIQASKNNPPVNVPAQPAVAETNDGQQVQVSPTSNEAGAVEQPQKKEEDEIV